MIATVDILLALQAVGLTMGGVRALDGVSVQVERGQRWGVVGGNGSGKSSVLRVMQGVVQPSSGTCWRACQPAMVFQKPHLLRCSVIENVALGLKLQGQPRDLALELALTALRQVGLAALAQRDAKSLSGGQIQRVALARALCLNPGVLLLDEPSASLDPTAKREFEDLMQSMADAGRTIVFASHHLGQVKRLATHVLCLRGGHVLAAETVVAFFDHDQPPAVQEFLKGES